jgi:hypothetical protein
MVKVNLDIVGTWLDTLSFFLVTTDLYGEERLRELGERLRKPLKFDQVFWAIWAALTVVCYWLLYQYYEARILWFKENFYLVQALIHDFTGFSLILLGLISLPVTLLFMPVLSLFSRGAAFAIDKWKMKGVFLVAGTALFVAARFVSVRESQQGK